MIPGPKIVYKCPKCGRKAVRDSLISGNTFGSELYSDGKRIAPMLPEFPYIIKCGECKTFYWLNDENRISEDRWWIAMKDESKREDCDSARFLSIDEYVEAINLKIFKTNDEEWYLRIRLWWAFNDKYRWGTEEQYLKYLDMLSYAELRCKFGIDVDKVVFNENDKSIYESNCIRLIEMLDKNKIDDKITCAELYRNLGNYTKCKNILETIHEEKYDWIKEVLTKECEKDNRKVIKLSK